MKYLLVQADVRYWDDTTVNGEPDEGGDLIGKRKGDTFEIIVDIERGVILDWNNSDTYIHYKVCDGGVYFLLDDTFNKVLKWKGYYVPNSYLCHGGNGYGDYIILKVNEDGKIENYVVPEFSEEEWESV